jgi:hypothetical protein
MARSQAVFQEVIGRKDYLRYSTALAYKAGLLRNDGALLEEIRARLVASGNEIGADKLEIDSSEISIGDELTRFSGRIEDEIRSKSSSKDVDENHQHDISLTEPAEEDDDDDDLNEDHFIQLLTLHSDIIRHTTELPEQAKIENIQINVRAYLGLVVLVNREVIQMVEILNANDLVKMLFPGQDETKNKRRIDAILSQGKRMVWRVVPTSIALHMADHLGTSRLCRAFLTAAETDRVAGLEKAYYLLLAYRANPERARGDLQLFLKNESGVLEDSISHAFIRIICQETVLDAAALERTVEVLAQIGEKYSKKQKLKERDFVRCSDHRQELRQRLRLDQLRSQPGSKRDEQ